MSFDHLGLIAELKLPPSQKLVLFALGNRACSLCGIAWPGKPYLIEMTGLGHTAVIAALKALVDGQYLTIHRYSHGGRGVSTEFIVLPNHLKLSKTAPCSHCQKRMKTVRQADSLQVRQMSKRSAGGGQNGPPGVHHSISETPFSQTEDPQASPSGSASPRIVDSTTRPQTSPEAARAAEQFMQQMTSDVPEKPPHGHARKP